MSRKPVKMIDDAVAVEQAYQLLVEACVKLLREGYSATDIAIAIGLLAKDCLNAS